MTTPAADRVARWKTTPGRLRVLLGVVAALSLLLFLTGEGALSRARSTVKTMGKDAAPSIIAAQEIASDLSDLDANLANMMLGNSAHRASAANVIEERRAKLSANLVGAAQNITYGDAERVPVTKMFDGLGRYLELVGQVKLQLDKNDLRGATMTYTLATGLLHSEIVPAANDLDHANRDVLDQAYKDQAEANSGAEAIVLFLGGGLVIALLYGQVFLTRRFRRLVNPMLLPATLILAGLLFYLVSAISSVKETIRVAKEDAFESVHAVWQARAIAYDANGDESRYLLEVGRPPPETGHPEEHEREFNRRLHLLTDKPLIDDASLSGTPRFGGLLAKMLENVTFNGEEAAIKHAIKELRTYVMIDTRIRALEKAKKHAEAVELCIGAGADESNAAFDRFDGALLDVLKINHDAFDAAINRSDEKLKTAEFAVPFSIGLIVVLTFLGLRKRIAEYD